MKKIFLFLILATFLFSCEKDETMITIAADPTPPSLTSHADGDVVMITESTLGETLEFDWSGADYGVPTQVGYSVQIDSAGKNFANPVLLATTQTKSFNVTLGELNDKLLKVVMVTPNEEAAVDIRIVSSINGQFEEISPVVTLKITTWKAVGPVEPTTLWVPGGYQGWNPSTAPVIYSVTETTYEGYVYIQEGTGFKFTSSPDWDHINYGDSGTPGVLTTDGLANGLSASEAGYYRFKVDVENLTYEMYRVDSFGIIGSATPGSWDSSTPMTFNPSTGLWTYVGELASGALKFRANNDWWLNYGPDDSNALTGKLIATDAAITINDPGTYTVILDFSRSESPWTYTYEVVKGIVDPEPAKLWIPGGYQASGGDPSQSDALTIYAVTGSNDKVFEGYITIPSSTWIKFSSAPNWGETNYGSAGDGTLSTDGAAAGIDVPAAGYYKIRADIEALTYSLIKIDSWGLIGDATPGGWDNSTPMDYNATTKKWTKTVDLANGALKFRANNDWAVNYGPADSNSFSGTLIATDGAISISEAGNYTVTVDLSRSASPYQYTYTVVKN